MLYEIDPRGTYEFRVRAKTIAGTGPWSTALNIQPSASASTLGYFYICECIRQSHYRFALTRLLSYGQQANRKSAL